MDKMSPVVYVLGILYGRMLSFFFLFGPVWVSQPAQLCSRLCKYPSSWGMKLDESILYILYVCIDVMCIRVHADLPLCDVGLMKM